MLEIDQTILNKTFEKICGNESVLFNTVELDRMKEVGTQLNKELEDYVIKGKTGYFLKTYRPDLLK